MGRADSFFGRFLLTVHCPRKKRIHRDESRICIAFDSWHATLAARYYRNIVHREIAGLPESRSAGVTSTDRSGLGALGEQEERRAE